jgi:hypothetical protein
MLAHIMRDIAAWRAAKRAALSEDYATHRADYQRRARDYARCIRANLRRAGL